MNIHSIELIFILLTLSVGVTALAKKMNRPYPIALVLIGAVIGVLPTLGLFQEFKTFFTSEEIFRTAVLSIFLPALLGEASLKLSFQELKENRGLILMLAFTGTFLAFGLTGGLTLLWLGLPLQTALVFGALMSPTDPVSVISVFKNLGVNRRLAVIMEGESLINDGVAVVLFKISAFSLAAIAALGPWGPAMGLVMFLKVVFGGLLIGLSLGFIISQAVRFFDDYPLENSLSVVLFYGSFIIAEQAGVSGVIAVVAAGLVLGNYGTVIGMSPTTRLSVTVFWDTLTLVANSLVFILVGLEISLNTIVLHILPILSGILIVLLGRSAAVYLTATGFKLPWSWKHVLNWGGLKGSLSIALALSLPPDFPARETLISLTFGVVFFSLVAQGLTIDPLIRIMGLQKTVQGLREYESLSFELQQAITAANELHRLREDGRVSPQVFKKLENENAARIARIEKELSLLYRQHPKLLFEQEYAARKKLLIAEHQAVEKLLGEGVLSAESGDGKKRSILERLEALEESEHTDVPVSEEKARQ